MKIINLIKKEMVQGHDDFSHSWCIHFDDWEKLKLKIEKQEIKIIEEFLKDHDLGMYYPDEMFTIPRKTIKDLHDVNKNKTNATKVATSS